MASPRKILRRRRVDRATDAGRQAGSETPNRSPAGPATATRNLRRQPDGRPAPRSPRRCRRDPDRRCVQPAGRPPHGRPHFGPTDALPRLRDRPQHRRNYPASGCRPAAGFELDRHDRNPHRQSHRPKRAGTAGGLETGRTAARERVYLRQSPSAKRRTHPAGRTDSHESARVVGDLQNRRWRTQVHPETRRLDPRRDRPSERARHFRRRHRGIDRPIVRRAGR